MFEGAVEVDKSFFISHVKYHKGKPVGRRVWIVKNVERHTKRIKQFPVHGRSAGIFTQLIVQDVKPGTYVYTDGWRSITT
jgi:IS1 family transposase